MISLALSAEPSVLSANVKEITARLQDLALYPNLSKKRMYGALHKGGAIRFDLKATEPAPQSLGIGIAGDGTLKEWQLTVYSGTGSEETAPILRKEKVVGENQWVFEILAPPDDVIIEIRNISSSGAVAVVEVVHGFYFGYSVDKENNTKPTINNPGQKVNPTEPEKLSPTDVQNRVEFIRVPLSND
ncbi:hypothetical protein EHS15_08900 [Leptospira idonii]|uniref:Uncharacterized protein n=2 Tax=Leptospira idonii TaxID=1193500 RepID=A0A4R9M408_9LEPT|nr:hypothetical protein EHS15_08900 [Leptospira idonii]